VVVIAVADELTVNADGIPLNVTLVAPVKFVPRIVTVVPIAPALGSVLTNGARPVAMVKAVPYPSSPPSATP
jgi:hypothetical protein